MAARRLLIVMLVLLGLSTLAAALVPQHGINRDTTTGTTTTQPPPTTTHAVPQASYIPPTKIRVGDKKFPVVSPVQVGQQLTLLVASRVPTQLQIKEFGQVSFAAPDAPARFELLPTAPGNFGVQFLPSGKAAAQIRVVAPGAKKKTTKKAKARSRARGG